MPTTKRLFIAVEVPGSVTEQLAPALNQVQGVQWHPGKNFHITIKFIGDTPIESIKQIESLMEFVGSNFPSFNASFKHLKVVESRLRLTLANSETLSRMREVFEFNLEKINLFHQDIIQYEPHITLGRVAREYQPPQIYFDFSKINFGINEIGLYETIRGETAAEFVPLKTVRLSK